jgi:hypothetical protein
VIHKRDKERVDENGEMLKEQEEKKIKSQWYEIMKSI